MGKRRKRQFRRLVRPKPKDASRIVGLAAEGKKLVSVGSDRLLLRDGFFAMLPHIGMRNRGQEISSLVVISPPNPGVVRSYYSLLLTSSLIFCNRPKFENR